MKAFGWSVLVAGVAVTPAFGCDLCAVYSSAEARGEMGRGFFGGVSEQFTHYGSLQYNGNNVANDLHQFMDSSMSQVFVGYNFAHRIGVQVNVPLIYRSWQRLHEGTPLLERGRTRGVGDVSVTLNWTPVQHQHKSGIVRWSVLGGVKLPTGNSHGNLAPAGVESAAAIAAEEQEKAERFADGTIGSVVNGIHPHDIALGSGSVDGIFGTSFYGSWNRFFATASMQYSLRTKGDFNYRFGDDLTWSAGPGFMLVAKEKFTASLQARASGEYKMKDDVRGLTDPDSGMTSVFVGPQLEVSWNEKYNLSVGADLPVHVNATSFQSVPDYRVRAAFTVRF